MCESGLRSVRIASLFHECFSHTDKFIINQTKRVMEKKKEKSVFETLNSINVNGKTEKKNGLTYLSWAFAWGEVKKNYPDAFYTIYEDKEGMLYHSDGRTCWVKTGVTINGQEHIEYLPVMDFRNNSIPVDKVTSTDVNKAIQRSLTKACARHGLGLYIYAGEDLPEEEKNAMAQSGATAQKVVPDEVAEAIKEAENCTTVDELTGVWNKYKGLRTDARFKQVVADKGTTLKQAS